MSKFEENFQKIAKELEALDKTFVIKGMPKEYEGIWTPNNEIRLWSIPRQSAEILRLLVLIKQPKLILELGTSAGYSTIWLASGARHYGGKVYTIELAKPKIEIAKKYFKKAGIAKHIKKIEGKISDVLRDWDKKIDFVFLDADKENYLSYIKQLEPFLNNNAVIVADNASDYKDFMKDYLIYVITSDKYHSYLLNIDHGLMVSVKLS